MTGRRLLRRVRPARSLILRGRGRAIGKVELEGLVVWQPGLAQGVGEAAVLFGGGFLAEDEVDPAAPQLERMRITRLLLTDVTSTDGTITAHVRLADSHDHTLTISAPLPIGDQRQTPCRGRHHHRRTARPEQLRRNRQHPQPARHDQRHQRALLPAHRRPHHPRLLISLRQESWDWPCIVKYRLCRR